MEMDGGADEWAYFLVFHGRFLRISFQIRMGGKALNDSNMYYASESRMAM
jgi:hypothetical protein